ncbi:MAG TPA: alpha-amylase family glycosyl hydrolase [Opitutaceae bacterium]|nr:alpha-amylase family glycosyl hydrolase [Opitutaceae bacterium]
MSLPDQRILAAWLTAPDEGLIELARDWTADAPPPLALDPAGPALTRLEPEPDHAFGRDSGYFVSAAGELVFCLWPADHPDLEPAAEVFLAGDFNGWQRAIGAAEWRLRPAALGGAPAFVLAAPAGPLLTDPPQRFKFVTGAHRWLPVPSQAPNAARDDRGNYNRVVDPARTGRHRFRFATAGPVDLAAEGVVRWADHPDGAVPLRPGDFFFQLKSHRPLGAVVGAGETTFRLFAPRACWVRLHLAERLDRLDAAAVYELDRRSDGTWEARLEGGLHGWFYWYTLDGPHNAFGAFDPARRILDPCALATVGREGPGIVVDRARVAAPDRAFRTPAWQDLVIAEAHVRDLTAHAPLDLPAEERRGFTGLRRWVESPDFHLARLGVNAVELQPVAESDAAGPAEYHWGYMPVNWFAPASGYGLDPATASPLRELQELVAAFHRRGMAVLLDVVYNHVGLPPHLLHVDKLYYFEQDGAGGLANWSACGNDVRASAAMVRRLIIDSLVHLVEVAGVDGFRFDLAELLGPAVLREIEAALKRVKPDVVLIAEPWSFRGHIARDLRPTGFASWNDGFRDFVRDYVRGGGTAEGFAYFLQGSPGEFAAWPAQTVNYTESHDDRTWIDTITENADHDGAQPTLNDVRRTHLMAAILFASIGLPMIAAGQDFLRSKRGVNNTYQRGDLNALDYRRLYRFPATHAYFADWIAFRRSERGRLFRQYSRPAPGFFRFFPAPGSTAAAALYNADGSQGPRRLLFAVNPTPVDVEIPLGEAADVGWRQLADHERFFGPGDHEPTQPVAAELSVPALGCGLWMAE